MSNRTSISWTDATWNMIRAVHNVSKKIGWMCVRVSQGCVNCYAADLNGRLGNGEDYTVPGLANVTPFLDDRALLMPLRWRRGRRVFVCSMTDLFGEWVPDEWIDRVFATMALASRHTFQVLTKRPERMRAYLSAADRHACIVETMHAAGSHIETFWTRRQLLSVYGATGPEWTARYESWPLPNVHLGVSVESPTELHRVDVLRETPAALRFLSLEPLLYHLGPLNLDGIGWGIVGGESGRKRRPFDLAWLESIAAQCDAAHVPLFVKQDSAIVPGQRGRIPDHLWRQEFPK